MTAPAETAELPWHTLQYMLNDASPLAPSAASPNRAGGAVCGTGAGGGVCTGSVVGAATVGGATVGGVGGLLAGYLTWRFGIVSVRQMRRVARRGRA